MTNVQNFNNCINEIMTEIHFCLHQYSHSSKKFKFLGIAPERGASMTIFTLQIVESKMPWIVLNEEECIEFK
jgi:hypothetical protein